MNKKFNLGKAISFSLQSLRKYPLLIMTPVAIQTIMMIGFTAGMDSFTKLSKTKSSLELTSPELILLMILSFLVMLAIYFLVLIFTQISIIRVGFKLYQGEEEPVWKDLFKLDSGLIGICLSCLLLLGLYIFLAFLACFIPGVTLYFVTAKLVVGLKILLIMVCMIPFFILLIYIMINYLFVTSIAVDTRASVNHIFKKSATLVKGIKWSVFGYLFLMFILPYPITRSIMTLKKLGYVWQYYSLYGVFTFLWTSLVAMIPVYLYKDLMRQQSLSVPSVFLRTNEEDLDQELEQDQAEELVEESPEL